VDDINTSVKAPLEIGAESLQNVKDLGGGTLTAVVKYAEGNVTASSSRPELRPQQHQPAPSCPLQRRPRRSRPWYQVPAEQEVPPLPLAKDTHDRRMLHIA